MENPQKISSAKTPILLCLRLQPPPSQSFARPLIIVAKCCCSVQSRCVQTHSVASLHAGTCTVNDISPVINSQNSLANKDICSCLVCIKDFVPHQCFMEIFLPPFVKKYRFMFLFMTSWSVSRGVLDIEQGIKANTSNKEVNVLL